MPDAHMLFLPVVVKFGLLCSAEQPHSKMFLPRTRDLLLSSSWERSLL